MSITGIASSSAARLLVAGAITLTTIAGTGVAAQAAPADPSLTVKVSRLVLEPTDRGYAGSISVALTYQGDAPAYAGFEITEPIAASFRGQTPSEACAHLGYLQDGRLESGCMVPGGEIKPGRTRRFTIDFGVLSTPSAVAMSALDTQLRFTANDGALATPATSRTLFRSTTGSLRNPVPFVQDTESDLLIEAADATLTRREDGRYAGRVPVAVTWQGNAPHYSLSSRIRLPLGASFEGLDPSEACGISECMLPGGRMMQGETRLLSLLVSVPGDTPLGVFGTGTVDVTANWADSPLTDVDPSDNRVSYRLVVA